MENFLGAEGNPEDQVPITSKQIQPVTEINYLDDL